MQETRVRSLGGENPREKEMATHSTILAWRIPQTEKSLEGYSPWDLKESDTTEGLSTAQGPEELNDLSKAVIVIKTPKRF